MQMRHGIWKLKGANEKVLCIVDRDIKRRSGDSRDSIFAVLKRKRLNSRVTKRVDCPAFRAKVETIEFDFLPGKFSKQFCRTISKQCNLYISRPLKFLI